MGTNVFEKDWELLVVLDTCRYDALASFESAFDFIEDVDPIWSVGSSTREWAANTYTNEYRDEIADTAVVSANGVVQEVLEYGHALESELARQFTSWDIVSLEDVGFFDSVWKYSYRDPFAGLVVPDVVTDRAVAVGRERNPSRLIAHYVTPHKPYRSTAVHQNRPLEPHERNPWPWLEANGDRETLWETYRDELEWVLTHVDVLLDNYDAETAILTADHGELFGEQGLRAHPTGVPHPNLRRVPWAETSAVDTGEYEPRVPRPDETRPTTDVRRQLENLGYA